MRLLCFMIWISTVGMSYTFGQNLVLNPSLEEYISCPKEDGDFDGLVKDWRSYELPVTYLQCDYRPDWSLRVDPYDGEAMCAMRYFDPAGVGDPRRGYVHGTLSSKLLRGKRYYIEYFLHLLFGINLHDQFSVYFTQDPLDQIIKNDDIPPYFVLSAQINNQKGILKDTINWIPMTGCFVADGGEQYFSMGNFLHDSMVNFINFVHHSGSMEFIDYVRLFEVDDLVYTDTILCQNTGFVPNTYDLKGLKTMLDGVEINRFVADQEGIYEIEYVLDGCGVIGRSMVEVIPCRECAQNITPSYSICIDSILSLEDLMADNLIHTDPTTGEIVTEFSRGQVGTYQLDIFSVDCSVVGTADIEVVDCSACKLYLPNVFTPNDDGINDFFRAFAACDVVSFEMSIFNRWGDMVFHSSDMNLGWNGYHNNTPADNGVYVYMIRYKQNGYPFKSIKGDVTLLSWR